MEIVNVTGIRLHEGIVQNISRITSRKIFKYKNISTIVILNSPTHAYINFIEVSDPKYLRPLCHIDIFTHGYKLVSSFSEMAIYYRTRGLIRDRLKIYRWLRKTIKNYRR